MNDYSRMTLDERGFAYFYSESEDSMVTKTIWLSDQVLVHLDSKAQVMGIELIEVDAISDYESLLSNFGIPGRIISSLKHGLAEAKGPKVA